MRKALLAAAFFALPHIALASYTISPDRYHFGTVTEGNFSEIQTFTLSNTGSKKLKNITIGLNDDSPGFLITENTCPTNLKAGEYCEVSVQFQPDTYGDFSNSIGFAFKDKETNTDVSPSVDIHGYGQKYCPEADLLEERLRTQEAKLDSVEYQIMYVSMQLEDDDLRPTKRFSLQRKLLNLSRRAGNLEESIYDLEDRIEELRNSNCGEGDHMEEVPA